MLSNAVIHKIRKEKFLLRCIESLKLKLNAELKHIHERLI